MKGLSELVLATAEIKQFAPGVDVNGPLLELQCVAFDMKDLLEPYVVTSTLQRYALERPQQVISEELPEYYSGNWESDLVWPGEIEIGGLHVRHGRFADPITEVRFRCSRCKTLDRDGGGKLINLQTVGGDGQESPARQAAELYCHELMENLYVGGIRICDPHISSYTMYKELEALLEKKGYGHG